MKFSDILKRKPQEESTGASAPFYPSSQSSTPPYSPPPPVEELIPESHWTQATASAIEVYGALVGNARTLHQQIQKGGAAPQLNFSAETFGNLEALLRQGNQEILALADRSTPDNYLHAHAANVAIYCLRVGLLLSMAPQDLILLGVAGFLADLGLLFYNPLIQKQGRLSGPELQQIRQHPADTLKLLSFFPQISREKREALGEVIRQSHERADGTGYPSRLKSSQIHPFAKILGLCDVFEALTHPRSWRGRVLPHQALRFLIDHHGTQFDDSLLKSFIESLSLYPPGSFVRISNGTMGRVIQTNQGLPTRPRVKVLADSEGKRLQPQIVNLATQPILYIADSIDEAAIQTADARLLLELRAQRWWVKGL